QRVHIGAIHIELGAAGVEQFGDFGDPRLEGAQGGRVRHHQGGDIFIDDMAQLFDVDLPARVGANVFDSVAGNGGGGGIGAVGRVWNEHLFARIPLALEISADQQ